MRRITQEDNKKMNIALIRELKTFDVDNVDLETAVALVTQAKAIRAEYEARNFEAPEWLTTAIRKLNTAIGNQTREAKELRLRQLRDARQGFLSREEKKTATETEIAALERELAEPTTK